MKVLKQGKIKKSLLFMLISLLISTVSFSEDLKQLVNLQGFWKFSIGDDAKWASSQFNDSDWDRIFVPMKWEEQGYKDYNGFAWYRKKFKMPLVSDEELILLQLGFIDDADEVYINGQLIGKTGIFPPQNATAYDITRKYTVPREVLNFDGNNMIAVRVYDEYWEGGIKQGRIGFYIDMDNSLLDLNLAGKWKFRIYDQSVWKEPELDDSFWKLVDVPGYWESNGFSSYDGFAWYRKEFYLPEDLTGEKLYLILGRIDDIDQTYFNGEKIGSVDELEYQRNRYQSMEFRVFRAYKIPDNVLKFGQNNLIAVRVYDSGIQGGIYEGPIGIATEENFKILKDKNNTSESMWEYIIKSIFDY